MKNKRTEFIDLIFTYGLPAVMTCCLNILFREIFITKDRKTKTIITLHFDKERGSKGAKGGTRIKWVTRLQTLKLNKVASICIMLLIATGIAMADDAKDIMQQVLDRDDGTTEISRLKLTTAKFVKQGNKLVNSEKPRVKLMDTVRKDYGPKEKDHKTVSIIIEPSSEKGIGFLQYDYDIKDKDTDQWIYLSAMGKVKRIVSGNDHEPKTGSFFGSEISYEDLEQKFIDDYTYTLLKKDTYRGRDCWIVESVPTKKQAKKSNYSKSVNYVDQETFIILKSILYNRSGKKVKQVYQGKIETIDSIHVPRQMIVINLETRRRTVMSIEKITINKPVDDDFLTKRTLTDGAFRERNLKKYQTHF